jgi:C-terminal processing protease CtpA/Prc
MTGQDITVYEYFSSMGGSAVYNDEQQRITSGKVFVWSPDEGERFPTGFGEDGTLFTDDDPMGDVPKGWSMIDLDKKPFGIVRDAEIKLDLIEGSNALIDYSKLSYKEAWDKLYERGVNYYAFTKLKKLDWPAIKAKIDPLVAKAKTDKDFAEAMRTLVFMFDDTHTAVSPINKFSDNTILSLLGEIGVGDMVITGDNQVVIKYVEKRGPADRAGLKPMALVTEVDGKPVIEALDAATTLYSGASTPWFKRHQQLLFFLRGKPNSNVKITFENPGEKPQTVEIKRRQSQRIADVAPSERGDPTELVATAKVLPSGIGYIKLNNFYEQRPLEYRLFKEYLKKMIDANVTGLIIDDRNNSGGWSDTGTLMAGFFYKEKTPIYIRQNSDGKGGFKRYYTQYIVPQEPHFDGPVAILVNANSVSEGDFFAYFVKSAPNGFVVGDTPTSGAGGGIQSFKLPGGLDFQWAETPAVTLDGENLLEGKGVAPDITVKLTAESIRTGDDVVLKAAEDAVKNGGFKK